MINEKRYFTSIMHDVLIILMILSMILIAQQLSRFVYKVGVVMLVFSTILQIGFGNIPSSTPFWRSMKLLGIALLIVISVFLLGIVFSPFFIKITRG
jgi:hypothetical protein